MSSFNREEQLKQLHLKRKQKTQLKVDEAINRLLKLGKSINFNSVAYEAGVTKSTLYNHQELRERIDILRNQQENSHQVLRIKRDEKNQNAIILSLRRRIEKLEIQNINLEKEINNFRMKENKNLEKYFNEL